VRHKVYQNYLLAVLTVSLAFNYVDRLTLGLLLQEIKTDLVLSDTQLGVITGFAFAIFYSLTSIPIARWADRGNRVSIIGIATVIWTVAVTLCGYVNSFVQLAGVRIGAAIAEAGSMPPAHSLIADYFSRAERPKAMAVYLAGGSLSFAIGYFLTGWLNEFYGWRWTFRILAVPGLVLAGLVWLTLIEPRTRGLRTERPGSAVHADAMRSNAVQSKDAPGLREVIATLWHNKTFRQLLAYLSVIGFFTSGIGQWQPAFFIRSHELSTGALGTWLALLLGAGGVVGTYFGGAWASRYAPDDERRQLRVMVGVVAGVGVLSPFIYLAHDVRVAFGLLGLSSVVGTTASGPLFATIQTLVPERMRATSIALIFLFANLIGMGLGPMFVGTLSDVLRPWAGEESLRYALLALSPGYFWAAWHVWLASRTVRNDMKNTTVEAERDPGKLGRVPLSHPTGDPTRHPRYLEA